MFKVFFRLFALPMIICMFFLSLMSCAGGSAAPTVGAVSAVSADNTLEGKITKIDSDGTITVLQENGRAVFIELLSDTKISRNGKTAKAGAFKVGDSAWVQYKPDFLPDFRKALEIRATGKD